MSKTRHRRGWAGPPVAVLAVLLVLSACAGETGPTATLPSAADPSAGAGYPVTIQNCGRTLTFDAPPKRVVTYYQPTVELMIALGLADRVVGRGGFHESPLLPDQTDAFNRIPALFDADGTGSAPTKETLFNAEPDLVVNNDYLTGYSFDPANGFATEKEIRDAGIALYTFTSRCDEAHPGAYTDIYTDLRNMAAIFGVPERAEPIIARMQATLAEVGKAVSGRPRVPVVFYDTDAGGTTDTVVGNGEYGDLLGAAGARNLFDDVTSYVQTSSEALTERKPEVWVVLSYGGGMSDADKRTRLLTRFPDAPASRNNRFVFVQNVETTASIRVADAVRTIARALHPEAF